MKIILRPNFGRRVFLLVAFIGLAYIVGYLTAQHNLFPDRFLTKLDSRATALIGGYALKGPREEASASSKVDTVFVNLQVDEIKVSISRKGSGGGLTSFDNELLLLAHDGNIFLASEDTVVPTKIETPSNGYHDYVAASQSEKYKDLEHVHAWFRYNDILFYSDAGKHGLVISYSEYFADKECYGNTIARLELPTGIDSIMDVQATRDDWAIIFRTQPCLPLKKQWRAIEGHIAGGRIAYRQPNKIVLGSGDYHWDGVFAPKALSQQADNDYGKVLEIDLDSGATRKISIGHRNTQGVLIDANGQLWVTEHGPNGGDELNRIIEGENFGWPKQTLGTNYNLLPWPGIEEYGRHNRYRAPTYAWVPSVGISNLTQIEGFTPSWDGDLLAASLRGKSLFRLRVRGDAVIFAERIEFDERIRYAHQHTDGRIVLWTNSKKLLFISLGAPTLVHATIEKFIASSDYNLRQQQRLHSAIEICATCHSFEPNVHEGAPGLGAIFGSKIAATGFSNYSNALSSRTGSWTEDELSTFIRDPQAYAPGTSMPDPGVEDKDVINSIVRILKHINEE